ncbi:hypothetical protein QE152_g33121 [Popillia japonica]|uniref:Uncharacterized protein n=1 Tax=Popillia japonica TaxID=7064 RepID=A0AAW1IXR6_POPJA
MVPFKLNAQMLRKILPALRATPSRIHVELRTSNRCCPLDCIVSNKGSIQHRFRLAAFYGKPLTRFNSQDQMKSHTISVYRNLGERCNDKRGAAC